MPKCKECGTQTKKNYYCQPCKQMLLDARQCLICGCKIANELLNSNRCSLHAGFNWFKCHVCHKDTAKRMKPISGIRTYCSNECRKSMCMSNKKPPVVTGGKHVKNPDNPYKAGVIKDCETRKHTECSGKMMVFANQWTECTHCARLLTFPIEGL